MTAETERALIERVCAGEANAFEPLVLAYQDMVYTLCLRMVKHEADAADLAQEAFVRAYRSLASFRGESKFSVWLYQLTANLCRDHLRAAGRRREISLTSDADPDAEEGRELVLPDVRALPEDVAERRELQRIVRESIAELPEEQRQLLTLREVGGLSYDEIGRITGLASGTVRSRLFRARKKLGAVLLASGNFSGWETSYSEKGGDGK